MRCPTCGDLDDKVVDSRTSPEGDVTRRRRECAACAHRFTTFERIAEVVVVAKQAGGSEAFDAAKLVAGIGAAAKGRPIDEESIVSFVHSLEARYRAAGTPVASEQIGLDVLEWLAETDSVAYMRFASVYKGFEDPEDFQRELGLLKATPPKSA